MRKLFAFLLCCLLLSGCSPSEPTPTIAPTAPLPPVVSTDVPTEEPTEIPTAAPTVAPNLPLTVFRGDDNAESFLSEEVLVPEINETVIVEQLITAGILTEGTAVNSIRIEGSQLNLDFNQPFADRICSMGTAGEHIIVGSTVNTFLHAYGADSVFFTINGEILESGHVIYDFPLRWFE